MSASAKLRELHEAASAYITHDELGQQAIRDANHFVDVMVDCAPQLILVVKAAEQVAATTRAEYGPDAPTWAMRFGAVVSALSALEEALS